MVIVDTSIWSLALRRKPESLNRIEQSQVDVWSKLTDAGEILLVGIVRQELLRGLRDGPVVRKLIDGLNGFPTALAELEDHDRAAECFNTCRRNGIAPGDFDMLICAMAVRMGIPVFTTDGDFVRFAKVLPIQLLSIHS